MVSLVTSCIPWQRQDHNDLDSGMLSFELWMISKCVELYRFNLKGD